MKLDKKAQISIELIILIAIIIVISLSLSSVVNNDAELTKAMISARNGAYEGVSANSLAIYPDKTFDEYLDKGQDTITHTKNIKIIKIDKKIQKEDIYNKTRIQLKVYASSPDINSKDDKESAGDRINYNVRKFISCSFNSENLSNSLYNPSFTPHYSFTTANVEWI